MSTEDQIRERLEEVLVPGAMRSLDRLNLIRDIEITDGRLNVTLASAAIHTGTQNWLKRKIIEVTKGLDGIEYAEINFTEAAPKDVNQIRNVVAIMSGKGGVGKSLVTSLTALLLVRRGYEVGILDADITGPSIPRMFGSVTDRLAAKRDSCRQRPKQE